MRAAFKPILPWGVLWFLLPSVLVVFGSADIVYALTYVGPPCGCTNGGCVPCPPPFNAVPFLALGGAVLALGCAWLLIVGWKRRAAEGAAAS